MSYWGVPESVSIFVSPDLRCYRINRPLLVTMVSATKRDAFRDQSEKRTSSPLSACCLPPQVLSINALRELLARTLEGSANTIVLIYHSSAK